MFACGLNTKGQLGIPSFKAEFLGINKQQSKTERISRGVRRELSDFTTNQAMYGNELYTSFTPVPISSGFGFSQLACGDDFTLLLTNNGGVLSTGSGSFGQHCVDHFKARSEFAAVGSETARDGCFETFGI